MSSPETETPARKQLESRAEVVRSRLMNRLDELDQRSHHLVETASNLADHTRKYLPVAAAVAATGVAIVGVGLLLRRRREPRLLRQASAFLEAQTTLARRGTQPSFVKEMLKKLAWALAARVAQRALERASHGPSIVPPPASGVVT